MSEREWPWGVVIASILAVALGLLAASVDVAAPFGDDTAKATVLLWLVSAGLLGFLQPRRPWRWALLIGPWVSAVYLLWRALGLPVAINPNTYTTILLLVPVSLAVCLTAAYSGSMIRRAVSRSA